LRRPGVRVPCGVECMSCASCGYIPPLFPVVECSESAICLPGSQFPPYNCAKSRDCVDGAACCGHHDGAYYEFTCMPRSLCEEVACMRDEDCPCSSPHCCALPMALGWIGTCSSSSCAVAHSLCPNFDAGP
jgi:hypothetical protein